MKGKESIPRNAALAGEFLRSRMIEGVFFDAMQRAIALHATLAACKWKSYTNDYRLLSSCAGLTIGVAGVIPIVIAALLTYRIIRKIPIAA